MPLLGVEPNSRNAAVKRLRYRLVSHQFKIAHLGLQIHADWIEVMQMILELGLGKESDQFLSFNISGMRARRSNPSPIGGRFRVAIKDIFNTEGLECGRVRVAFFTLFEQAC